VKRIQLCCIGLAVTALWPGRNVAAQTVAGLALDDSSRVPLAGSLVRLLDRNDRPVSETRAGADGAFYLTAPTAGMCQATSEIPHCLDT
jgi:hypothetical protein